MRPIFRLFLLLISTLSLSSALADVSAHFNHIKNNPKALYTFFKAMPKGGELHYHLAGGPSAEVMLELVANKPYCINTKTKAISPSPPKSLGLSTDSINKQTPLYHQIIKSWSMEGFKPGAESSHDHFFNTFMKFMPIVSDFRPELIADILERAAQEHEQYIEVMDIADNAQSAGFGSEISKDARFTQKRKTLLSNKAFQDNITHTVLESERVNQEAHKALGCASKPQKPACQIEIKYLYYVLREQAINNFFAQALNAFEAVARSKGSLVGVNLVQAEDGPISLRDYHEQMLIFNFLHQKYPEVHIALHAGEITPELVEAKELSYHIKEALFIGKAQRIGHGVDIRHETDSINTLKFMAKNHIPIEINLTSNQEILGIKGDAHPIKEYLKHKVPVVLSTDDEGILRTNLSQQYVTAVTEHHLSYEELKQINRNTLTFAFIPGKSIWENADSAIRVPACRDLDASSCKSYIKTHKKAYLQWTLEKKLMSFERTISSSH